MHFHGVAADLLVPAVEALLELGARKYRSRPRGEGLQDGVFASRDGMQGRRVGVPRASPDQGSGDHAPLGAPSGRRTPGQRTNARRQLVQIKRLHQVVVRAGVEPFDTL